MKSFNWKKYGFCCKKHYDNAGLIRLVENLDFVPKIGFYADFVGHNRIEKYIKVNFCPWCGTKLEIKNVSS